MICIWNIYCTSFGNFYIIGYKYSSCCSRTVHKIFKIKSFIHVYIIYVPNIVFQNCYRSVVRNNLKLYLRAIDLLTSLRWSDLIIYTTWTKHFIQTVYTTDAIWVYLQRIINYFDFFVSRLAGVRYWLYIDSNFRYLIPF